MSERWILFFVGLTLFTVALLVGWRGRKKNPREATVFIMLCLVPVLARAVLILFPGLEYRYLGHDEYAIVRPWWSLKSRRMRLSSDADVCNSCVTTVYRKETLRQKFKLL